MQDLEEEEEDFQEEEHHHWEEDSLMQELREEDEEETNWWAIHLKCLQEYEQKLSHSLLHGNSTWESISCLQ